MRLPASETAIYRNAICASLADPSTEFGTQFVAQLEIAAIERRKSNSHKNPCLGTHHDGIGHSKNRGFGKRLPVTSGNRGSAGKTRGALSAHGIVAISTAPVMTT